MNPNARPLGKNAEHQTCPKKSPVGVRFPPLRWIRSPPPEKAVSSPAMRTVPCAVKSCSKRSSPGTKPSPPSAPWIQGGVTLRVSRLMRTGTSPSGGPYAYAGTEPAMRSCSVVSTAVPSNVRSQRTKGSMQSKRSGPAPITRGRPASVLHRDRRSVTPGKEEPPVGHGDGNDDVRARSPRWRRPPRPPCEER